MTGNAYAFEYTNEDMNAWRPVNLKGELKPGEHVIAISLHNCSPDSSDLRIGSITLFGSPVGQDVTDNLNF